MNFPHDSKAHDDQPQNSQTGDNQERDSFRHDLRTHLSAIVSLTDLIRNIPDPRESAPLLDALHLAAANALAIMNGGSHLQQPTSGETIPLAKMLRDFERLAKGLTQAQGANFTLSLAENCLSDHALSPDPVYLHRILMLLLDNALKYGEGADVTLDALCHKNDGIELFFADRGPGFRGQDTGLLFEPYQRGVKPDQAAGSGLGLWSARAIVTTMGGTITARENTPTGALFHIHLPIRTESVEPSHQSSEAKPVEAGAATTQQCNKKILVVDDNRTNHLIMDEMLKAMQYSPLHAASGSEALAMLENEKPDIAIIDIRMAEMDGWELARLIRSNSELENLLLVGISADTAPSDIAPFNSWLQRPINPVELNKCLLLEK